MNVRGIQPLTSMGWPGMRRRQSWGNASSEQEKLPLASLLYKWGALLSLIKIYPRDISMGGGDSPHWGITRGHNVHGWEETRRSLPEKFILNSLAHCHQLLCQMSANYKEHFFKRAHFGGWFSFGGRVFPLNLQGHDPPLRGPLPQASSEVAPL